jgi:hypothetical protein
VGLSAAALAYALGLPALGIGLGGLVATLALLAASTGFCLGCQLYRVGARLRGVRGGRLDWIELDDFDLRGSHAGELIVSFGHPLCTDCQTLEAEIRASGRRLVTVDVRSRRDLARKYGISLVPTAVSIAADGRVLARLAG